MGRGVSGWLYWVSVGTVAVWLGETLYYFTQELLVCFPWARLWR